MAIQNRDQVKRPEGDVIIAPSVLSADFSKLASQVRETVRGGCPWIHLDVMDNHFVPNLTFGAPVVKSLRPMVKKAYFDAHLMVSDPASMIDAFAEAGVQLLTVHQEACGSSLDIVLKQIRKVGMDCGVSIKPNTPLSTIENVLDIVDLVLIMTVEPGFGGQALLPHCVNKIRDLNEIRAKNKYKFLIQADGGINLETAKLVAAAGTNVLVAGSAVYNTKASIAENIEQIKASLKH